jgi:hypothetical protein
MGSAAAAVQTVAPIIGGIKGAVDEERSRSRERQIANRTKGELDDASLRREATYRGQRQALAGAIESFYKQKGWELPKHYAGEYTTRALPGEGPLYPEDSAASSAGDDGQDTEAPPESRPSYSSAEDNPGIFDANSTSSPSDNSEDPASTPGSTGGMIPLREGGGDTSVVAGVTGIPKGGVKIPTVNRRRYI